MGITSIGSGNVPSALDQLAVVDDADEAPRGRGDDLLARERAAAALDEMARAGGLVGAVDIDVQLVDLVQVEDRDADGAQARGGGVGAARPRLRMRSRHGGEGIDEEIHGGAGADADDRIRRCERRSRAAERGAPLLAASRVQQTSMAYLQKRLCPLIAGTVSRISLGGRLSRPPS